MHTFLETFHFLFEHLLETTYCILHMHMPMHIRTHAHTHTNGYKTNYMHFKFFYSTLKYFRGAVIIACFLRTTKQVEKADP